MEAGLPIEVEELSNETPGLRMEPFGSRVRYNDSSHLMLV